MRLKTLIFSKTKHDMCCKSCSCLVVLWKLCKLCSSWVSGCFALMKRSEIVVLVQVAREIVFKQDTALHRAVAVLCAYIVDCFFKFVGFVVRLVEKADLHAVFVFQPDCRHGDCAKGIVEIVYFITSLAVGHFTNLSSLPTFLK